MTQPKVRAKIWPFLIFILVLTGAAVVYLLTRPEPQAAEDTSAALKTTTIQANSLSQSATGTGKIIAAQTADISFPTSGTVAQLYVQLGDAVKAGQILAELDGKSELEQAVENARLDLLIAQEELSQIQSGGEIAIAQALAAQAVAQSTLAEAQKNLRDPHAGRCDHDTTAKYYQEYLDAVVGARPWQALLKQAKANGQDLQYYQENLQPFLERIYRADINYQFCLAYTPEEISASQAALQLAEAVVESAETAYQTLVANHGIDPVELVVAKAAVANAQTQLAEAEKNLAGATLLAPISGTITALNGEAGEAFSGGTLITLSDLSQPQLEVTMDEIDLQSFAVGCQAEVTFTSLTDLLTGQVSLVYPQLTSTMDSSSVQGIVTLDAVPAEVNLPLGLNAYVDITCNEGLEALTVPLQALLQDRQTDAYYVYILSASGQPEKREVVPGIQTANLLEIKSGLSANEKVITNPEILP